LANHTPDSLAVVADTVEGALTGTSGEQALLDGFMRATEFEPMYHWLCEGQ
jgi:hypothetical protein